MIKLKLTCFILLLSPCIQYGQDLRYFGILPILNQSTKINSRLNFNLFCYGILGSFDKKSNVPDHALMMIQTFGQTSIVYSKIPALKFSLGYSYQRNYPFKSNYTNEHRLWEQLMWTNKIRRLSQTNRFRIEERFINRAAHPSYQYSTRFRYQVGVMIPLNGPSLEANEFYCFVTKEFCFSTNDFTSIKFTEDWSYAGIGYTFKKSKLELGYLLMVLKRDTGDLHLNLMQLTWYTNFSFRKKQT